MNALDFSRKDVRISQNMRNMTKAQKVGAAWLRATSMLNALLAIAWSIMLVAPARAATDADRAVLAAHEKRRVATVANDAPAVGSMMTDDFTFTHPNGVSETKAQFVNALKTRNLQYQSITDEQRRVRVHGDSGIVSGTCRIVVTASGTEFDVRVVFTELWVKKGKAWRMALWHATNVP